MPSHTSDEALVLRTFPELGGKLPPIFQVLPGPVPEIVRVSCPRAFLAARVARTSGWVARWVVNGVEVFATRKEAVAALGGR